MSEGLSKRDRRRLPLASDAASHGELAGVVRAVDAVRPIYAVWEITLRCDLACAHCGSRAGVARPDELSTDEALDLVRQMAELGVREVSLIGGEAYLREDWLDVVRAIRTHGMVASLTTGGRGIDAEKARAAFAAGLQAASVSIDGLRATHDDLRRLDGSFDAALHAIRELSAAGLRTTVNTQINRRSLRELPEVLELLIAHGARAWQVQLTVPAGRALDGDELLLEPFQLIELMPMLARLKRRADEARVGIWPGNNVGYFGPHEADLRAALPGAHSCSCGAGRTTLGIEANGDVKGCPSLPTNEYVGGNLRAHSLREIWERSSALRFTRDRPVSEMWGFCAGCYYAEHCLGGCSWTAHSIFGRRGNNPLCHHRTLELLAQGKRERLIRVAAAPGVPFDYGRYELVLEDWPAAELERARAVAEERERELCDAVPVIAAADRRELTGQIRLAQPGATLRYTLTSPARTSAFEGSVRGTALLLPGLGGRGARGYGKLLDTFVAGGFAVLACTIDLDDPKSSLTLSEEIEGWLLLVENLTARGLLDPSKLSAFGHSRGGLLAPVLSHALPLRSIVVYGTPSRRLVDSLVRTARRQLALRGVEGADMEREVERAAALYRTLLRGPRDARLPDEVRASVAGRDWHDGTLFGEPVVALRELDALDPAQAWPGSSGAVLALRGEADFVIDEDDPARTVAFLSSPRIAEAAVVAGVDHGFMDATRAPTAHVFERALGWMTEHVETR